MALQDREIISIVQLIVYFPILIASVFIIARHGLRRDLGWIYLTIFALARIVGAIMLIVADSQSTPSIGLFIAALVIQSAGLSPLMLATSGFLGVVAQGVNLPINRYPIKKFFHLGLIAALVLAIIAGSDSSDPTKISTVNSLRKASAILFLVIYVAFVLLHGYYWAERRNIPLRRRTLLLAISCALPFLGARLAFSLGSAFSPPTSSFSLVTGSAVLYGLLAVFPEFVVVLDYTIAGLILPFDEDLRETAGRMESGSSLPKAYAPEQQLRNPYSPVDHHSYPPTSH